MDWKKQNGLRCVHLRMATFSGAICGQLLGSLQGSVELAFSDEVRWACAEDPFRQKTISPDCSLALFSPRPFVMSRCVAWQMHNIAGIPVAITEY